MDKNSFFARTMHTPDSPERAELRDALRELSRTLIPVHRRLIESAKSDYAFAYGANARPSELVELLQNDPFFAWLKPLTAVIVDIDEMARTDFEVADVAAIVDRIEKLLGETKYIEMLQRDIDVATGHAALRRVMQRLKR
ncbi:MAG: hypothetical protein DMF58_12185 [Acidobacteria bacterium]|nr:MAG: hypothetical protein DMF58_12185 [Acidobacteriota bacterium]